MAPGGITLTWAFNLDDLGSHLRCQRRRIGLSDETTSGKDTNPLEGTKSFGK
jgi:hypothetical protein